jgi:response regulator RpfG family c-di-GMP phosphodiesterase
MRILIVDDSATSVMLLEQLVRRMDDCFVLPFTDPLEALAQAERCAVDLALVDYVMPGLDGVGFVQKLRTIPGHEDIPIIMVTMAGSIRYAALEAGATDFLTKPIDPVEAKSRIKNMLKLRESQKKLAHKAFLLAEEVKTATAVLAAREEEIIFRLSRAVEYRDPETGRHAIRMAQYCRLIGQALGLDEEFCRNLYLAAPMHDVGKIAVSDSILLKADDLSDQERELMQQHTVRGYEILSGSNCELLQMAADIARSHHEHWDGSGYPSGLRGAAIPLVGRIVAVADVFDALTTKRPYKSAWTPALARAKVVESAGKQFDPACVEAFVRRWDDVLAIHRDDTRSRQTAA